MTDLADSVAESAVRDLSTEMSPDQVMVSGPGYDDARRLWNAAIDRRPAVVVRATAPVDVQVAVRVARRHDLPISVRAGGHDWAGRALRDGGLVIDLTGLRQVAVDPANHVATLGGGATVGDLVAAATPHQLAAATGAGSAVGMAGLTLGGGFGPLIGRAGLALDNLVGADVVLADGDLVTADATHEQELFWALRGGGGNFGVVTALRVRLHPVDRVIAGFILFPWAQAADVLARFDGVAAPASDDLTVDSGVLSGPDGGPTLTLRATWSGADATEGERAVAELERLGTPLVSQVRPMGYADMLRMFDAYIVPGGHYALRTRSVAAFTPEVIAGLVDAGATRTSPLSAVLVHHFHGAAARVPIDATAFGLREPHFVVQIMAAWPPDDGDGAAHRAWADSVSERLALHALPGGYANLLGPDDDEQIAAAYGPNAPRLRAAKARFDPDKVFTAIPLPLTSLEDSQ
jgi:FAD/FMN-containing dehydrogenase